MNSSLGPSMDFLDADDGPLIGKKPKIILPKWRFEYYLIGGACTVCFLVVVDNYRAQKFDRLIAIMSGSLGA